MELHKHQSVFLGLDEQEKAFVVASVKIKMENDKKREKELKRKSERRR